MAAATSFAGLLTNDGSGNWTPTVKRNATITGGSSITLPVGERTAFEYLPATITRARRAILNARSAGTITNAHNAGFQILKDGAGNWTVTASYGAVSLSGGTSITLPVGDRTAFESLIPSFERIRRAIANDYSTNG